MRPRLPPLRIYSIVGLVILLSLVGCSKSDQHSSPNLRGRQEGADAGKHDAEIAASRDVEAAKRDAENLRKAAQESEWIQLSCTYDSPPDMPRLAVQFREKPPEGDIGGGAKPAQVTQTEVVIPMSAGNEMVVDRISGRWTQGKPNDPVFSGRCTSVAQRRF